jgi:AraC-like DNA-binding protein
MVIIDMNKSKVAISLVRHLFHFAKTKGIDEEILLNKAELKLEDINNPDTFIDRSIFSKLLHVSYNLLKDEHLGLHLGEHFQFNALGIVGYLVENAATGKEVFLKLSKFNSLIGEGIAPTLDFRQDSFLVKYNVIEPIDNFFDQQCLNSILVKVITGVRIIVNKNQNPKNIFFSAKKPDDISEYQRIFQCPIHFNSDFTGIELDNSILEFKVVTADSEIHEYLEQKALKILNSEKRTSFIYEVKRLVMTKFPKANVNIDQVASEFAMSVRTFQRKLKDENHSFKTLVDQIRKDVAIDHIKSGVHNISQIAYLMGFSEASAFNRSFKRWTGFSPKLYRSTYN